MTQLESRSGQMRIDFLTFVSWFYIITLIIIYTFI